MDAVLIIFPPPCFRMIGIAYLLHKKTLFRFTFMTLSHSSGEVSSIVRSYWVPALLIKISNLPVCCIAFLIISWTSVCSESFALTKVILFWSRRAFFSYVVSSLLFYKHFYPLFLIIL